MQNKDSIKIKLLVAGRYYPMLTHINDEENIRKAGKLINESIKNFEKNYQTRDKQDALAMCALEFAVKFLSNASLEKELHQDFDITVRNLIDKLNKTI